MEAAVPTIQYDLTHQVGNPAAWTVPSGPGGGGAATSQLAYFGFQHSMYPTIGRTDQHGFSGFSPPPMIPRAAPQLLKQGQVLDPPAGAAGASTMEVGKADPEITDKQQKRKALMPFIIISLSYLLFTITDGSVRMIVLLHA